MFTQQRFLGASITHFTTNLGWGHEPSVVEIGLVEDPRYQEYFDAPDPGYLVRFQYNNWIFDGLLDNYTFKRDHSGNRVINVVVKDPRSVLNGVQLILSGYNGAISVPNIYNVYGYLENISYGYSGINDLGIPVRKITEALNRLLVQSPMTFQGVPYIFRISNLPPINPDYRISGSNMSLMDFINNVCDVANCDYFFKAQGNVILLYWISRNQVYVPGSVGRFINTLEVPPVSIDYGVELQENISTKLLVGGQQEKVFFVAKSAIGPEETISKDDFYSNTYKEEFASNTIWPYWGLDANNNAIVGQGWGDDHMFLLNGSSLKYPMVDFTTGYPCDIQELRAAAIDMQKWSDYVQTVSVVKENISFGKAARLALPITIKTQILEDIFTDKKKAKELLAHDFANLTTQDFIDLHSETLELKSRYYNFVKKYADEFLGRKYLVQIPNILAKLDLDTFEIKTSLEPTESGYIGESDETTAVINGYMPMFKDFVKTADGKIEGYCGFNGWLSQSMDISALGDEDFIIEGNNIFVKCTVDPKVVWLDRTNLTGPRVVVTLAGPIYSKRFDRKSDNILWSVYKKATGKDLEFEEDIMPGENTSYHTQLLSPLPIMPTMMAVPLKDNYATYGPWQSNLGTGGIAEFEKNEELVPWNFGSFEAMNRAGQSLVNEIYANQFFGENGSVTIPGAPNLSLGDPLITSGPYITNISVRFDPENGVTTTYRMNKWTTKLGKQNRQSIQQYQKTQKIVGEQRRMLSKLYKSNRPLKNFTTQAGARVIRDELETPKTPHHLIVGQVYKNTSGIQTTYKPVVISSSMKEAQIYLKESGYNKKGGCSMDNLFYPFATYSGADLPYIKEPSYSGELRRTGDSFNFFGEKNNSAMVFNKSGDISNNYTSSGFGYDVRSVGLNYPIYIVDQDVNGNFRAGPLDLYFDQYRQVWTVRDCNMAYGFASGVISANTSGYAAIYRKCTNLSNEVYYGVPGTPDFDDSNDLDVEIVVAMNLGSEDVYDTQRLQMKRIGGVWVIDYVYC